MLFLSALLLSACAEMVAKTTTLSMTDASTLPSVAPADNPFFIPVPGKGPTLNPLGIFPVSEVGSNEHPGRGDIVRKEFRNGREFRYHVKAQKVNDLYHLKRGRIYALVADFEVKDGANRIVKFPKISSMSARVDERSLFVPYAKGWVSIFFKWDDPPTAPFQLIVDIEDNLGRRSEKLVFGPVIVE